MTSPLDTSTDVDDSGQPWWRRAVRTTSRLEAVVVGAVATAWAVILASVLAHPLFVSHDSISNNAHVWFISRELWHHHQLPVHMPMLAHGKALTFPYASVPWLVAALLRPLFGDWAVTLCLVGGFVALVVMMLWALPGLRRGWSAAAVLVNPALVMALLVGQVPFIWAAAFLFGAIGAWQRRRWWAATVLAGLAMITHAAVAGPMVAILVVIALAVTPDKRRLLGHAAVAAAVAFPAALAVVMSPAFEQSSPSFRLMQILRIVVARGTVVGVPLALAWARSSGRARATRWQLLAPAVLTGFVVLNAVLLGPMNRYAWGAPWRHPDERVMALIDGPAFVPGATYRVLGFSDGRVSMYRLIQHGAQLDGELFPESQARHSWPEPHQYEQFLLDRRVDFVMAWTSYDIRWGTNEHALLTALGARPTCDVGGVEVRRGFEGPRRSGEAPYEVFSVRPCPVT